MAYPFHLLPSASQYHRQSKSTTISLMGYLYVIRIFDQTLAVFLCFLHTYVNTQLQLIKILIYSKTGSLASALEFEHHLYTTVLSSTTTAI